MFRRIHWRIAVSFTVLVLIAMGALDLYLSNIIRASDIESLRNALENDAALILEALELGDLQTAPPEVLDAFAKEWSDLLGMRVTFIELDGTVIGESDEAREDMENHADRPEVMDALAAGNGNSIRFSDTLGTEMLYAAVRLSEGEETIGVVRLASPLSRVEAHIAELRTALFTASLFTVGIVFLLAILISSLTTRPLRELTQAAQRMSEGIVVGSLIPTNDEIGDLTNAFNKMADSLQTQIMELEGERSKLAAILEQMRNGVMIVDRKGRVVLNNRNAARMFGLSSMEIETGSLVSLIRHHKLVELWQESVVTGETQTISLEIPHQSMFLQVVASPMGEPLLGHTLLIFLDMTRVQQLETVRQDFISNVSHELRTPLASLKALTETLLDGALDDPPAARRFLSRIEIEVDSLSLMVQELLELSRIESGRVPLQIRPVHPADLIGAAHERLRLQAERAGLTISEDVMASLPRVSADRTRMIQVLMNLLHNAIKFTPAGGDITLSASFVKTPDPEREEIVFEVRDSGVGIPFDDLPRIFERFYKADRARTGGGTGLGLAIAKHMVETHRGRIWVESIEGEGSSFFFTLPVETE